MEAQTRAAYQAASYLEGNRLVVAVSRQTRSLVSELPCLYRAASLEVMRRGTVQNRREEEEQQLEEELLLQDQEDRAIRVERKVCQSRSDLPAYLHRLRPLPLLSLVARLSYPMCPSPPLQLGRCAICRLPTTPHLAAVESRIESHDRLIRKRGYGPSDANPYSTHCSRARIGFCEPGVVSVLAHLLD